MPCGIPILATMMNLVIGLCFGIASAIALIVMWRAAARLRRELEDEPAQQELADRRGGPERPSAGP